MLDIIIFYQHYFVLTDSKLSIAEVQDETVEQEEEEEEQDTKVDNIYNCFFPYPFTLLSVI